MDSKEIREKVYELPVSPMDEIAQDHEIWEGVDGGATFKLTRHSLDPDLMDFYAATISGQPAERHRLIAELSEILGNPFDYTPSDRRDVIESVGWLADRDLIAF